MSSNPNMAELVETLCDLFEKDGARTNSPDPRPKVFPPASKAEIRAFEKRMGRQFPPSYVEFLTVTNGMLKYQRVFTLIGVKGEHTETAIADIEKRTQLYVAAWEKNHGKATDDAVAKFEKQLDLSKEKEDAAHIFPGNKLVVGTDSLGSLFYFLGPDSKQDSEPKIIWRDNLARLVVYDNFREMLNRNIKVLSKRLGIQI
jgi:hypothetical protein